MILFGLSMVYIEISIYTMDIRAIYIYIYIYIYIEREREISIYTMDIHGIYRDLYIYHEKTKKYHNSTQNCPF